MAQPWLVLLTVRAQPTHWRVSGLTPRPGHVPACGFPPRPPSVLMELGYLCPKLGSTVHIPP